MRTEAKLGVVLGAAVAVGGVVATVVVGATVVVVGAGPVTWNPLVAHSGNWLVHRPQMYMR